MGECESCQNIDKDQVNTIVVDLSAQEDLQPADFYNATTKAVAKRLGPFKYDEDSGLTFVSKGPIKM